MQENGPDVWVFVHLDTCTEILCKQDPDETLLIARRYSEGAVIHILCHLFARAPLSNAGLARPAVVFFQIQDS